MNRSTWLRALVVCATATGAVFELHALLVTDHAGAAAPSATAGQIPVTTAAVEVGDMPVVATALGRVAATPAARFVVTSRAGGLVTELMSRPGDHVEAGSVLLRFERAPLEAAVAVAQAAAAAAGSRKLVEAEAGRQQRLDELTAAVDVARTTVDLCSDRVARLEPLIRDHLVARSRGDEVAAELVAARHTFDLAVTARAGFVEAIADLERGALDSASVAATLALDEAKRSLADAEVRAPIAGVVASLQVSTGDRPVAGSVLCSILAHDGREVAFAVNPAVAARLAVGAHATWSSASGAAMRGSVRGIASEIASATGMAIVLVDPEASSTSDAPGLVVVGELEVDRIADATIVPEAALVRDGAGVAVVVLRADGTAAHVAARVIARHDQRVAVVAELPAGTRVIVSGAYGLADGARVAEAGSSK